MNANNNNQTESEFTAHLKRLLLVSKYVLLFSARSHKFGRQGHSGIEEDEDDDYGGGASGYNGDSFSHGAGELFVCISKWFFIWPHYINSACEIAITIAM